MTSLGLILIALLLIFWFGGIMDGGTAVVPPAPAVDTPLSTSRVVVVTPAPAAAAVVVVPAQAIPAPVVVSGSGRIYVVQSGDTLFSIARRSGLSLAALLSANPQITNPNRISQGQQIRIPI